ncbi:MAG TPA: hypothetical protein VGG34_14920 [Opitutaceae bacterium]
MKVTAIDQMVAEYGMTEEEADAASTRIAAEAAQERIQGKLIPSDKISTYAPSRSHKARPRGSRRPTA